jgi:hypothetical protein
MCPVPWLAAVVRAEVPDTISLALEDRLDHRLAWVDFAVDVRPAKAALPPCTAADFMRHINRRALRLPEVAEQLQRRWSSVPALPLTWPADLCEQAMGSLARRFMLEVCPKERPAPTKDWISDTTWTLLRKHAGARQSFFDLGRTRRQLASQFWFRHWRAAAANREPLRRQLLEATDLGGEVEADAAVRQALAGGCLQRASAAAAAAVKVDMLCWLRARADFVAEQAAAGRQAPLWELVRQLAGRKAARGLRPVAVQRTADGTIISRREVLLACWEDLFSAEFGGFTRIIDFGQAREEVSKIIRDFILTDSQESEFEWICSLVDALASCKLGRAVGPDAVPVEFMQASGIFFVRLVAQVCKAAAATGIPFIWRGGMMAAVPRKVQKPLNLANARGVLCSSTVGKLYGKCLRKAAIPALVAESQGTQFGAIPGGGTDLPSVAIQMFLEGAARRGRSVAVLFTDIRGAFYRCLPEIALGPLLPEGERLDLFAKLGLSPAAGQALHEQIVLGSTALARHEVPAGWRSALADWHRGSWFMVRGSRRCILPSLGVRPGDPPADAVFALAFDAFLKLLNVELAARGLQPAVPVAGPGIFRRPGADTVAVPVGEQTYMDDTAVPLEAPPGRRHLRHAHQCRRRPHTGRQDFRVGGQLLRGQNGGGGRSPRTWARCSSATAGRP